MKTKILLLGAIATFSFFISCNSDETRQDVSSKTISNDEIATNSKIDASIDDVSNIAEDQFGAQQNSSRKATGVIKSFLPECAVITTVLTDNTWTRTIDFGTEGCTLSNGNTLKGKITISFTNDFSSSEHTITYSFENFYHNGNKIQGSKSISLTQKATALLATVHPVSTSAIDMTITFEDGKIYKRTGTLIKEMIAGFDTWFNWDDNTFIITGTGETTFPNGDKISTEIILPLEFSMACKKPFPVKGSISITKNEAKALIDFGNGDCDDLAVVTRDGVSEEIHLKK
ncbi:hypothetical protein [Flavobacterium sp. PL02]|jgi:hypothetical protein|uniref:hypothetical protein n=1 Tax=Flavobacterium sp. PL02 TaxID=3088354 RepID=UPI002B23CFB6|nr:hypothetical protein [Flavobacterium sp. PL02]MEA9411439.1 hypothetical protein [Flavobacterium sp. PL02]